MFDQLEFIEEKYHELGEKIADPEVISNQKLWQKLMKEHADLAPIVEMYNKYASAQKGIEEAKDMIKNESDLEMRELAKMELAELEEI